MDEWNKCERKDYKCSEILRHWRTFRGIYTVDRSTQISRQERMFLDSSAKFFSVLFLVVGAVNPMAIGKRQSLPKSKLDRSIKEIRQVQNTGHRSLFTNTESILNIHKS